MDSDKTSNLLAEIEPLKGKLDSILTKVNETFAAINNILTEQKQEEIKNIITNVDKTMEYMAKLSSTLETEKTLLANTLKNAEAFTATLAENAQNITTTLTNLAAVSDSLQKINIGATITKINNLVDAIHDPNGTVGQLLTNEELYQNLTATLRDLDLLLQDIKANPKKYVKLSLF
jgi:phospholipid/cholesterol/gamma-HCH transport system substrate-binding protein